MITLSSTRQFLDAMHRAHAITLSAYVLRRGAVLDALVRASTRGAQVRVRLDGSPYRDDGSIGAVNRAAIEALRAGGADARLVGAPGTNEPVQHLKGAVVDGALFLDDRNWGAAGDTIVRDGAPSDVASARDAIEGTGDAPAPDFALRKREALALEAETIASARRGDQVIVESESFGDCNRVYRAIEDATRGGARVRLIVAAREIRRNSREASALQRLAAEGVQIRFSEADEKFAVVAGTRAWLGSANASAAFDQPDQLDWGLRTRAKTIVAHLCAAFDRRWR